MTIEMFTNLVNGCIAFREKYDFCLIPKLPKYENIANIANKIGGKIELNHSIEYPEVCRSEGGFIIHLPKCKDTTELIEQFAISLGWIIFKFNFEDKSKFREVTNLEFVRVCRDNCGRQREYEMIEMFAYELVLPLMEVCKFPIKLVDGKPTHDLEKLSEDLGLNIEYLERRLAMYDELIKELAE